MEHLAVSTFTRVPITQNLYLRSRTRSPLAGSCASTGISFNSIAPAIARRGFSTTGSFKAMAMQGGEGEPRFPPQHQDKQPGKEYLMNPLPQFANPDYKPSAKLHGKVALVTGGDSGIGRSICYHFSIEGATIAFTYVKGDEDIDADDTLKIINDSKVEGSSDPIAIPTDLRYIENCKDAVEEVIAKYGRIDILVNNPAVQYHMYTLDDITEERLENVFKTNIFSAFFMTRHAVKHMKEGSSIINTTSFLAYKGSPKWLDYCSTKGAIVSFTRGLSSHLLDKGIRVNGVAPGPVWTPLEAAALNEEEIATFGEEVPMDRAAHPYEIATSYVFLASEDSSYFTGQVLHPNGKSCLWSQSLLDSGAIAGICTNIGAKPAVSSLQRRGSYAIHSFKAKAMQKEEGERRFPPQHQESQPGKEYIMNPLPQFRNPHYKPSGKLHGKVALVTGGDSGIGRSVCYHFAMEGATVAFTYVKGVEDIDANATLKIINEARVEGSSEPIAIPTDVRYDKNCKYVVDEVVAKYGCIDILVNHPAVQYYTYSYTLDEITEERLEKVFRTNIFSYFFLTRHALKHMKEGSKVICTTSVLAYVADPPSWIDYISTKGAIVSFIRAMALHLAGKKIRVNGVAPGPIWTPLQAAALNDEDIARLGSNVPMDRAGQPYEIATSYVFLASEDSSYFTGQVLHPNGGTIVNG